jgi:hypothetical protein
MGGGRVKVPVVLAATLIALAFGCWSTSVASAARGSHLYASFRLKGSGHYPIIVEAWRANPLFAKPADRHRGKVTITVRSRQGSASYTTRAKFNRHRIRADLRRFGDIHLRFHKRPKFVIPGPAKAAANKRIGVCEQGGVAALGEFRGTFRFRGEGGYTHAHAGKVRGFVGRNGPLTCHGHDHLIELVARSDQTKFMAFDDPRFGVTYLRASTKERVDGVEVHREAFRATRADAGEFTFDPGLTTAHVAPGGGAFTGSADFSSPANWAGSLAVSFLGEDDVPLGGPGYRAALRKVTIPRRALSEHNAGPRLSRP